MLSQLEQNILRKKVVDYVLEKFESGLLGELKNVASEIDRQQSRKRELEGELANLTRVLASGQLSSTIMIAIAIAIAEREREISEITERMFSSREDSIKSRIVAMRTTAKSKFRDFTRLTGSRCNCHALCVVESYR